MDSLSRKSNIWLGSLIIFLGFFVFLHHLDQKTLWLDEGWTLITAQSNFEDMLNERLTKDIHPPLYFIEVHFWFEITGDSVLEMRYFSLLLGVLSAAVLYRLGSDLYSNSAGFIASVFLILNDLVIVLTQQLRHYPQMLFLTCLVMLFYVRIIRTGRRRYYGLFTLAGTALLWSLYWGGLVLLGLFVYSVLTQRKKLSYLAFAYVAISLLFIPWLPMLYIQMTQVRPNGLAHAFPNNWTTYQELALQLIGTPQVIWLGFMLLGCFEIKQQVHKVNKNSLMLLLLIVLPISLSIILNHFYPTLLPRTLIIVIPSVCLLLGAALAQFSQPYRFSLTAILIIQALVSTSVFAPDRHQWDEVAQFLAENSTPSDTIVSTAGIYEQTISTYYLEQIDSNIPLKPTYPLVEQPRSERRQALRKILAGAESIWLVEINFPFGDLIPLFFEQGYFPTTGLTTWELAFSNPIQVRRWDKFSPEDEPLVVFGNTLALQKQDFTKHHDQLIINLMWSLQTPTPYDYTISLFLLNQGSALVVQDDGYPINGTSPTSTWESAKPYFDNTILPLDTLATGTYTLALQVYFWQDGQIQNQVTTDCSFDPNCKIIRLGAVDID